MRTDNDFLSALIQQFWDYAEAEFSGEMELLDSNKRNPQRPPVFRKRNASNNILISPNADEDSRSAIVSTLPIKERHRHFGSMRSSQALAQSVFAALDNLNLLHVLADVPSEDGTLAFGPAVSTASMVLEHEVTSLNEPRPTSIDVWFDGDFKIRLAQGSRPSLSLFRLPRRSLCPGRSTPPGYFLSAAPVNAPY